jgi:hypothetical protein
MLAAVQTVEEIKADILSYLQDINAEEVVECEYNESRWRYTHGYRRAFCRHTVFKNEQGEYAFDVRSDDQDGWLGEREPNMGIYSSFDAMLQGVAQRYHNLWGDRAAAAAAH